MANNLCLKSWFSFRIAFRLLKSTCRLDRNVNKGETGNYATILLIELVASVLEPGDDLTSQYLGQFE
jgi:hypothetical protein